MQYLVFRCLADAASSALSPPTEILAPEDDLLLISHCTRCVEAIQGVHSAVKQPDWPDVPPSHVIL